MEIKEIYDEIKSIKEENEKLQYTKKRYAEFGQRLIEFVTTLNGLSDDIISLAKEIDPVINIKVNSSAEWKQKVAMKHDAESRLIEMMRSGQQVTREFAVKTFPGMNKYAYANIMQRLKKMPDVKYVKDGRIMRLFI